jgi:hypothetical protein
VFTLHATWCIEYIGLRACCVMFLQYCGFFPRFVTLVPVLRCGANVVEELEYRWSLPHVLGWDQPWHFLIGAVMDLVLDLG